MGKGNGITGELPRRLIPVGKELAGLIDEQGQQTHLRAVRSMWLGRPNREVVAVLQTPDTLTAWVCPSSYSITHMIKQVGKGETIRWYVMPLYIVQPLLVS